VFVHSPSVDIRNQKEAEVQNIRKEGNNMGSPLRILEGSDLLCQMLETRLRVLSRDDLLG